MTSVLPVNNGIYSYVMVHHLVIVTQLLDPSSIRISL